MAVAAAAGRRLPHLPFAHNSIYVYFESFFALLRAAAPLNAFACKHTHTGYTSIFHITFTHIYIYEYPIYIYMNIEMGTT